MDSSDESDGGFDPSKGAFRVNLDKRPSFSQLARRTVKIDASPRTATPGSTSRQRGTYFGSFERRKSQSPDAGKSPSKYRTVRKSQMIMHTGSGPKAEKVDNCSALLPSRREQEIVLDGIVETQ